MDISHFPWVHPGTLGDRSRYDALMQVYDAQYQARLNFGSTGQTLRAPRFGELTSAVNSLAHAADIQAMLAASYLVPVPGTACYARGGTQTADTSNLSNSAVPFTNTLNAPAMSLKLATHLLTHPTFPAKHCMVIDTG